MSINLTLAPTVIDSLPSNGSTIYNQVIFGVIYCKIRRIVDTSNCVGILSFYALQCNDFRCRCYQIPYIAQFELLNKSTETQLLCVFVSSRNVNKNQNFD